MEQVPPNIVPVTFLPFSMATHKVHEVILYATLRALLQRMARHLSLQQMNLLESHFQLYGQVPWSELINPVWSKPFSHMEEAWLVKGASFMHPERAPPICYHT